MKKKIILVLLAGIMLTATACSGSKDDSRAEAVTAEENEPEESGAEEGESEEDGYEESEADESEPEEGMDMRSAPAKKGGRKIEFTTTDIDGNTITSEEIFSQHKVTMVNVWATWCTWCIKELPELEEINERLAEKDCAIVGLLGDGTDEDTVAEGKGILEENGVEYLNILPWDGATDTDFNMDNGWPTSFFVDQDGRIVSDPIVGAHVDEYEAVIDKILNK